MGPKDNPDALFAIGTTKSCEAIGFLFLLGFQCLLFYTVFLTYYFMRRIKYKVTAQNFAKKEEKYLHGVSILITFSMALTALVAGSINPQGYGSLCGTTAYPEYCDQSLESGTCERGDDQITKYMNIYGGALGGLSFLSLFVILASTSLHVYKEERTFKIPARAIGNVNNRRGPREEAQEEEEQGQVEDRNRMNKHVLTKQALIQSLLYIVAFITVYFPPSIGILRRRFGNTTDYPEWLFWLNSLFTPLGGVFNILIYTRPKVLRLKEDYPHVQTWRLLIVIVLTGGEVPSLADLRQERSPTEPRNNTNDEEPFNDNGQVNESQGEQDDDLFSYEMDVSDALDYLSYSSGSGWLSSFWGSGN